MDKIRGSLGQPLAIQCDSTRSMFKVNNKVQHLSSSLLVPWQRSPDLLSDMQLKVLSPHFVFWVDGEMLMLPLSKLHPALEPMPILTVKPLWQRWSLRKQTITIQHDKLYYLYTCRWCIHIEYKCKSMSSYYALFFSVSKCQPQKTGLWHHVFGTSGFCILQELESFSTLHSHGRKNWNLHDQSCCL